MKISKILVLSVLLISCSGISPKQKEGMDKMAAGNFSDALVSLEAAKKEGTNNDELFLQLSDVKFKYAQEDLEKVKQLNKNDLTGALALLTHAKENAASSLEELKSIPKVENSLKNISAKEELLAQAQKELEAKTVEHQALLQKVQGIKSNTKTKAENAYIDCNALSPFKDYVPEVKEAYEFISQSLISELDQKGWKAFDANKLSDAKNQFDKILKYFPGNSKGNDGLLCLKANDNFKKQDFKATYQNLQDLKKSNPQSSCVTKLEKNNVEKLIKSELSLAHKLEKESKITSQFQAMDHYNFLLSLPEFSAEQIKTTKADISEVRASVAKMLVAKSKAWRATGSESLPLVFSALKWAYRFDPTISEKNKSLMEEAYQYVKAKAEFRALLVIKGGEASPFTELEQQIRVKIVTASPTPASAEYAAHYGREILTEDYVKSLKQIQDISRSPASVKNKISPYDYILWVNLLDYKTEEYGANQPYYQASRYVSGTRMLDNQAWFAAQQEFNNAQAEYNQNYQANQQMMSQCNNMSNAFAAGFCKGAISGLSSSRLDSARATLNATPRYVQENIISDYTYRQYKVGVNIYMRLEERFMDYRHNELAPVKVMEYKINRKEGEILEGVQPSDVNGIKEGRFNVPDLAYEKKSGENKLAADLESDLKELAIKEKGLRYCHTKGMKKETEVMGAYQLCLFYAKNVDTIKDKTELAEFQTAQKKLGQFYQLNDSDLQKYALSDSELPQTNASPFREEIK